MAEKKSIKALIEGGAATAGPPLGPALGPLGVNVMAIVNRINELTKEYSGMKVPVEVVVDRDTKEFEVNIGTPTTSALIVKELGISKGSKSPKAEKVGNLSMSQVVKIAQLKRESLLSIKLNDAVKEVLGSCISMGVTVEGKDPKEIIHDVNEGAYNDLIKE